MGLIPTLLRPSVLLRRKAMRAGFLGPSTFWKVVGIVLFGRSTLKKMFGRTPEVIDASALGPGRAMELFTAKPLSKRQRKRLRRRGVDMPTLAEQRERSRYWALVNAERRAARS